MKKPKTLKKRVGWTTSPGQTGYWAAVLFDDGSIGNGVLGPFKTKKEAQGAIDSGQVDEAVKNVGRMQARRHK